MSEPLLHELAEAGGIAVHWHDAHGTYRTVAPDVLKTMLAALGLPAASDAQARDSLGGLRASLNGVAEADDLIDGLSLDICQRGVEGEAVAVHIGNDRNAHHGFSCGSKVQRVAALANWSSCSMKAKTTSGCIR